EIGQWLPDVVGIGAMTAEAPVLYALAEQVKKRWPQIKVVAGGAHATAFTEEALLESRIDYLVLGEGEETFKDLLDRFASGRPADGVPGTAYREGPERVATAPAREYLQDLDALPYPDWEGIKLPIYHGKPTFDLMNSRARQMSIFTSRACPFECIYCHNVFGKVFRARSAENVVGEIRTLYRDYGVQEFLILDDIFNIDLVRAKKIARMLIAEKMDISLVFCGGFKADLVDEELIDLLAQAGMERIAYAIESASPRIQRLIKKNMDLEKVARVIRWTAKRGVIVRGYFMVGFPTETREEILQTIDWACRSDLTIASFMRVQPFQGTQLRAMVDEMGMELNLPYEHYNYDYSDNNLSTVPTEEVEALHRRAYQRFYGNPARLWALATRIPNKRRLAYFFGIWLFKMFVPKRFRRDLVQGERASETNSLPVPFGVGVSA
ncbi:MAG: B12-binding domain-containing radical SAM protein, partial [Candidatus Methylomirabilis sp.]|nr:B12-binding domain-containing radical SAM protein [Deltaproteobacteria bacterium]